jgi:hypothetical protein
MSLTICCHFVNGIRFRPEDAIVKIPNPLWGKCKFDPETGKKVEQFNEDKSKYHQILNMVEKLDSREPRVATIYNHADDSRMCFVGDVYSVKPWENMSWNKVNIGDPHNMNIDFALFTDMMCMLDDAKVKYERGCFLVQYVG